MGLKIYCRSFFEYLTTKEVVDDFEVKLEMESLFGVRSFSNSFFLLLIRERAWDIVFDRVKKVMKGAMEA